MLKLIVLPILYLALWAIPTTSNAALAFQNCQGGGCNSAGGRGGAVIEVTTLDDSGVGSLRACAVSTVGSRMFLELVVLSHFLLHLL
jgi:pectate lyase